jgi:FkbM family methyltransferase
MQTADHRISHPSDVRARVARSLRGLSRVRGWGRITNALVPKRDAPFVVRNHYGLFAGTLSSFIDWQMYVHGGYEDANLEAFFGLVPSSRRGTILDIGANVGTHSLAFARCFAQVHAFEPNPAVWGSFEHNMALNSVMNVRLHKIGLGDRDGELPFYSIAKTNFGLGTCSPIERYDQPLQRIATVQVRAGDDYLRRSQIGRVDAMKIDVQGYEAEVLRGLAELIRSDRPYAWVEIGSTLTRAKLAEVFPYPVKLLRFERRGTLTHGVAMVEATGRELEPGDYVLQPA